MTTLKIEKKNNKKMWNYPIVCDHHNWCCHRYFTQINLGKKKVFFQVENCRAYHIEICWSMLWCDTLIEFQAICQTVGVGQNIHGFVAWVIHKPRGQILGIFDGWPRPLPPSWSLLLNKAYVIKWSFGSPSSTSTVHVVYGWPLEKDNTLKSRSI